MTDTAPNTSTYTVTTVYKINDLGDGNYEIIEDEDSDEFILPDPHSDNKVKIDYETPLKFLKVVGFYDIDDRKIGVYLVVAGKQLGGVFSGPSDKPVNFPKIKALGFEISLSIFLDGKAIKATFAAQGTNVVTKALSIKPTTLTLKEF